MFVLCMQQGQTTILKGAKTKMITLICAVMMQKKYFHKEVIKNSLGRIKDIFLSYLVAYVLVSAGASFRKRFLLSY